MSNMAKSANEVAEASPYSSPVLNVYFLADDKKLVKLSVHRALVAKHTKLLNAIVFSSALGKPPTALPQASPRGAPTPEVGHILVNWLYTDTYKLFAQDVEPSPRESLKTAFGVYTLARQYHLPDLKKLARAQGNLLGNSVDIYTTIDAVLDVFPPKSSEQNKWLDEFLSSRTKAALERLQTSAAMHSDAVEPEEGTFIGKTIVRRVIDAYRVKAEDLAAREAALEERERALAEQQMSFDHAVEESAAPEPPVSDYDLPPEEVPSAFAMAVVEELALGSPTPVPPEDDWVMTSPREAVPEPEPELAPQLELEAELEPEVELSTCTRCKKCKRCGKKCRNCSKCKRARLVAKTGKLGHKCEPHELETKGEPEPEPEPVQN